ERYGNVKQDYGGVTGVNLHVSLLKQANPTAPNTGLVELARMTNSLSAFDRRNDIRPSWGTYFSTQSFSGQYFTINNVPAGTSQILFQYRSPYSTVWRSITPSYQNGLALVSNASLNFSEL